MLFEEGKENLRRKSTGSKSHFSKPGSSGLSSKREMTDDEKKDLTKKIKGFNAQQLKGVIFIVREFIPEKDGLLEFDVDK